MIRNLLVAMVLAACTVPISAEAQSSFDCRRPRSETVATICRDPDLSARDRQIDTAYRKALNQASEPDQVRDNHTAWAQGLSGCGSDRQCIVQAYGEELRALEYATEKAPQVSDTAVITDRGSAPVERTMPATARSDLEQRLDGPFNPVPAEDEQSFVDQPVSAGQPTFEAPGQPEMAVADLDAGPSSQPRERGSGLGSLGIGALFILPILAVVASLLVVRSLANHAMQKYGWPLILNWWNALYLVGFFGGCFVASLGAQTGDALPMGLGFFGAIWLILLIVNIHKTSLLTGLAMTLIQPFVVFILWAFYGATKSKMEGRRI